MLLLRVCARFGLKPSEVDAMERDDPELLDDMIAYDEIERAEQTSTIEGVVKLLRPELGRS